MGERYDIEVFFDGECPLCMREIRVLRRLDRRGLIRFTDIAAPGFDAAPLGKDLPTLNARIHGRLPTGEWVEGVEVFRRLYGAVGFGRITAMTRAPGISHALDWAYERFAKNRLRLTGRCDHQTGACAVPEAHTTSRAST